MEQHRSLNMQLPRGWYQVAGITPHTFRRHGLSTASGKLQISLLAPPDSPVEDGEAALALLRETLVNQDIAVGMSLNSGHEQCTAGTMAYAVYKHVGGQHEYWLIPNEASTVFAAWEMGAKATAGMERQEIHSMLRQLYFETDETAEDEEATGEAETAGEVETAAEDA